MLMKSSLATDRIWGLVIAPLVVKHGNGQIPRSNLSKGVFNGTITFEWGGTSLASSSYYATKRWCLSCEFHGFRLQVSYVGYTGQTYNKLMQNMRFPAACRYFAILTPVWHILLQTILRAEGRAWYWVLFESGLPSNPRLYQHHDST